MRLLAIQPQAGQETYQQAIELFLMRCRGLNLSPKTLAWYQFIFKAFESYLAKEDTPSPLDTKAQHIRGFLDCHIRKGNTEACIRKLYDGLRTFFTFLAKEGILAKSPMESVEKPKGGYRVIKPFSQDQIQLLLAQPNTTSFIGIRNWTVILLLLDTGLRVSELISLKVQQVDWQGSCVTIMGKGRKERTVPFGAKVKKALWDYFKHRGEIAGQDVFFVDQFGRELKARWIQHFIARYGQKAGIQGVRVSPHTLRHTFATQYILNGGDAFSLQQILGHSTLDMVRIYVGLANRDVALQHQKYSPIDRLGILPQARKNILLK